VQNEPNFKNIAEEQYSEVLNEQALFWDYERLWGTKRPDFTVYSGSDKRDDQIVAIVDQKDLSFDKEDMARLMRGETVSRAGNPHTKIRSLISANKKQFESAVDYPCIFVVSNSLGPPLPSPIFVMAGMLGDYTIHFPAGESAGEPVTASFGKSPLMVDPSSGEARNTTITAVGLQQRIRPDDIRSGFSDQLHEHALSLDFDNEGDEKEYLTYAEDLRTKLEGQGYDLNAETTAVHYIVNPFARRKFTHSAFRKPYTTISEYNLGTQVFDTTWTWHKN
jgi:hypothetical protein